MISEDEIRDNTQSISQSFRVRAVYSSRDRKNSWRSRSRFVNRLAGLMIGGCFLCLTGCQGNGEEPRQIVQGSVTYGDQPVSSGEVRFIRLDWDPDEPAPSIPTAAVVDGHYRLNSFGGILYGTYRVEVDARQRTGKQIPTNVGTEMALREETISVGPSIYSGADSPLTTTVNSKSSTFDIQIPSTP